MGRGVGGVGKVFEKRFGGNEKTLLPLHPAAEIKRDSSWKKGVVRDVTGDGYGTEKRVQKTLKKSLDGMQKTLYLCNPNGA